VNEHEWLELLSAAQEIGMPVSTLMREAANEFVADFRERKPFRITK
jgi:hypothetical protein